MKHYVTTIILEPPGGDHEEGVGREADGGAGGGRRRGPPVRRFSFTVHLFERHLSDAVFPVLVDHGANSALLLHHLVVSVAQACQPGLIPRQLTVTYQRVICDKIHSKTLVNLKS